MNALHLPSLKAYLDGSLVVELDEPDRLCGKGLLYATEWLVMSQHWGRPVIKNVALKAHSESPALHKMRHLESLERGHQRKS